MTTSTPEWEYTDGGCDVWQLGHLVNHFAEFGWEPLMVTDGSPGQKADRRIGHPEDGMYEALAPKVVLFRRPSGWGDDE